ncbi:MAG: hypothetical protein ACK55I_27565, partial [bacterium]
MHRTVLTARLAVLSGSGLALGGPHEWLYVSDHHQPLPAVAAPGPRPCQRAAIAGVDLRHGGPLWRIGGLRLFCHRQPKPARAAAANGHCTADGFVNSDPGHQLPQPTARTKSRPD